MIRCIIHIIYAYYITCTARPARPTRRRVTTRVCFHLFRLILKARCKLITSSPSSSPPPRHRSRRKQRKKPPPPPCLCRNLRPRRRRRNVLPTSLRLLQVHRRHRSPRHCRQRHRHHPRHHSSVTCHQVDRRRRHCRPHPVRPVPTTAHP